MAFVSWTSGLCVWVMLWDVIWLKVLGYGTSPQVAKSV